MLGYRSSRLVFLFSGKRVVRDSHLRRSYLTSTTAASSFSSSSSSSSPTDLLASNPAKRLTWSYTHGASDRPLIGVTVGKLLQDKAGQHPDREAVVFPQDGQRVSFQQLLAQLAESFMSSLLQADRLAAGLLSLGLQRGDRVGVWGPNSVEWVITQYATARAGLVLVTINPMYQQQELEFALNKVGCKALIAAPGFKDLDYYHTVFELIPELATCPDGNVHSHRLPSFHTLILTGEEKKRGALRFDDLLEAAGPAEVKAISDLQDSLQFDDPVNIQFTSGTTGVPKAATLSHFNIVNNSYTFGTFMDYHNRETRICNPMPLYHCSGLVLASLEMVTHGATVVFPSKAFDAGLTLQAVQAERCTALYGVPTMFVDMLSQGSLETVDLSTLYMGVMGGSPCPTQVLQRVMDRMHIPEVTVVYGTTETSPLTFQTRRDCDAEKRFTTVGTVLDHVEAKVVNEEGKVVPVGETGELCTRGFGTMLGYWDDQDKTAQCITSDRWYHTGDQAVMDEDGYCRIVGRLTDMIIRGGENVYSMEIEQLLYTHPKVMEVQVVGVPDERLGEEICACIQLKPGDSATDDEIQDFCKEKLARFKVPRYIKFVDSFPMTVTGKIQKFRIHEQAKRDLGLEHH